MRRSDFLTCLAVIAVLAAGCAGPAPTPEPDRVATRVAEELAVAATLTAAAPKASAPLPTAEKPTAAPPPEPEIPAATLTPTAQPEIPAEAPTATPLPPAAPLCRVTSPGLNLRSGPGVVFNPPLEALPQGTEMRPLAFLSQGFPSGQWIEVQVVSSGSHGWTSAKPEFVACNVDVNTLPPGISPPTPLPPSPTATRVQPPTIVPPGTPAPVLVQIVPVDGSDGNRRLGNNHGVNEGRNILLPGFAPYEITEPMVFRDRIVFRVEVFDRAAGQQDGVGIESMKFTIRDESGSTVHERTERTAGYCAFGGGEPDCVVWRFSEHDDKWPGGDLVRPGVHDVQIFIKPRKGETVTWFWSFRIER